MLIRGIARIKRPFNGSGVYRIRVTVYLSRTDKKNMKDTFI